MEIIFDSFSTRETAWTIWLLFAFIVCMFKKNIRQSIFTAFKCLFAWKISVSLLAFIVYTSFFILILFNLTLWDLSLLKDTIIWAVSFGVVTMINVNNVKDKTFFKKIFIDSIKWTIAIEFVLNFFTFSLSTELFLVLILIFSAMMQSVASLNLKHKLVEKIFKYLLAYISILIFLFSLFKTVQYYSEIITFDNLRIFLLPVFLTITFLPFMYFFNLFAKYEMLWLRLKFIIKNKNDRNRVKRQILWVANINIDKLVNISNNIFEPINLYGDLSNEMIKKVSKGMYISTEEQDID